MKNIVSKLKKLGVEIRGCKNLKKIDANIVEISLIPHTLGNTTLGLKSKSDTLNIETDIIGKYVERLLSFDADESEMDVGILKAIRHLQYGES